MLPCSHCDLICSMKLVFHWLNVLISIAKLILCGIRAFILSSLHSLLQALQMRVNLKGITNQQSFFSFSTSCFSWNILYVTKFFLDTGFLFFKIENSFNVIEDFALREDRLLQRYNQPMYLCNRLRSSGDEEVGREGGVRVFHFLVMNLDNLCYLMTCFVRRMVFI